MRVLVTGTAGFIGYHLTKRLLNDGYDVLAIDNLNDYYDVNLKYARLENLGIDRGDVQYSTFVKSRMFENLTFVRLDLTDAGGLERLFHTMEISFVCNLAAQAGVRYSMDNPHAYVESNITGFLNLLEVVRAYPVKHFVFASSSSVYGQNMALPFSEVDPVDHPISLYAASKKTNELMAHTYSHLFGVPLTGLRFFTVYGPWGRPDMAPFLFADSIVNGKPLKVFNNGIMKRDFTYIDDIIESAVRIINRPPLKTIESLANKSPAPYRILNIGRGQPIDLMDFIRILEQRFGKTAILDFKPMQPGDVPITWADTTELMSLIDYAPKISLMEGVSIFVDWYKKYYDV